MSTFTVFPSGDSDLCVDQGGSFRVFAAGNSKMVGQEMRRLLHVSGSRGLVRDEAGGILTNTRAASTVTDCDGVSRATLVNEIRFSGAQRIQNLVSPSEDTTGWTQFRATAALTNDIDPPTGYKNVIKLTEDSTANTSHGFQKPIGTININSVTVLSACFHAGTRQYAILKYTGSTARVIDLSAGLRAANKLLDDNGFILYLGNGWYRFIIINTATSTQAKNLVIQLTDNASGNNHDGDGQSYIYVTGFFAADITNNPRYLYGYDYVGAAIEANFYGAGIDAVKYSNVKPATSVKIGCWGDSLTDSTYPPQVQWHFPYIKFESHGYPSETSTQIMDHFLVYGNRDSEFLIVWVGRNNRSQVEQIKSDIAAMLAELSHSNFLIISVTSGDRVEDYIGGAYYDEINQLNSDLSTLYGNQFIDAYTALINNYDPDIPQDVIDYGHGVTPSSLRVDSVHLNQDGYKIVADLIQARIVQLGWPIGETAISPAPAILHNGDAIKLPLTVNTNFKQDKGIIILKLRMKAISSILNKALFAFNTGATDFLYDNGLGGVALSDGTNTATAAVGGWAVDDILLIGVCFDSTLSKMSVHVSKNGGAWIDSSDVTYDGAFPVGSNILWCSGNTDTVEIMSTIIEHTDKSHSDQKTWLKANAASEAV